MASEVTDSTVNQLPTATWINWKNSNSVYIYITDNYKFNDKICAFDFDNTLIIHIPLAHHEKIP